MAEARTAELTRNTKETRIQAELNIDGTGESTIETGIPFFDHMLTLFARHGLFDLKVKAEGDIDVDYHHTVEDTGIVLGQLVKEALGEKRGIRRYGFFLCPWMSLWHGLPSICRIDKPLSTKWRRAMSWCVTLISA